MNADRQKNGLRPLRWHSVLADIAEARPYDGCGFRIYGRAYDMGQRQYFAHQIKDCQGQYVFNMEDAAGIHWSSAGENACSDSFPDPVAAADACEASYMNSPEHRANILNPNYTDAAVGTWEAAAGQGDWINVQEFVQL